MDLVDAIVVGGAGIDLDALVTKIGEKADGEGLSLRFGRAP